MKKQALPRPSWRQFAAWVILLASLIAFAHPASSKTIINDAYTISLSQFGIQTQNPANGTQNVVGLNLALQYAASRGYRKVYLPRGEYWLDGGEIALHMPQINAVRIPSNMTLDLGGSHIHLNPNGKPHYAMFAMDSVTGSVLQNGTLYGDRDGHDYTDTSMSLTHEFGYGVSISSSENCVVRNMKIEAMTGDGIILTGYQWLSMGGMENRNIKLIDNEIANCRRQGISLVAGVNTEIAGNTIYNISGTPPENGIDVEVELDFTASGSDIHDNTIRSCSGGSIVAYSGDGYTVRRNQVTNTLSAFKCSNVRIEENEIDDNAIVIYDTTSNVTTVNNRFHGIGGIRYEVFPLDPPIAT